MALIIDEMERMQSQGGFSKREAVEWGESQAQRLREAGFSEEDIDKEFGKQPFNEEAASNRINKELEKNLPELELAAFNKNLKQTSEGQSNVTNPNEVNKGTPGLPKFTKNSFDPVLNAGQLPRAAVTFEDFWKAGTGMGLEELRKGKMPDVYVPENASFIERLVSQTGTLWGDAGGFLVGGALGAAGANAAKSNPISRAGQVMGAAFGTTEVLRAIYVDAILNGEIIGSKDFTERLATIMHQGFKGYTTGFVTGTSGKIVGRGLAAKTAQKFKNRKIPTYAKAGNFLAETATEVGVLVTVGNALEGRLPEPEEFGQAAVLIFGLKGGFKVTGEAYKKVAKVFKKEGVDPFSFTREANEDVTVRQDALSSNIETPRLFEKPGSRTEVDPVDPAITKIETAMRSVELKDPKGTDPVGDAIIELRKELKKEGLTDEAIEVQVAEAIQAAQDRVTDHTIAQASKQEPANDSIKNPATKEQIEDALVPIRQRLTAEGKTKDQIDKRIGELREEAIQQLPEDQGGGKPPPEFPTKGDGGSGDGKGDLLSKVSFAETRPQRASTYEDLYTAFVDDIDPIRNDVKAAFGKDTLPVARDPYKLARIYRGLFSKVHTIHEFGTIDFNTFKINGGSLKDALEPIRNNNEQMLDFRRYALGKDAIDSAEKGVDVGLDLDLAREFVSNKEHQKLYEPILKDVVTFQNNIIRYAMDGGLITRDSFNYMVEANKNHIPMFRLLDPGEFGGLSKAGVISNPFKKRKGADTEIIDPLESIIKNTHSVIGMTDRNHVARSYIDMADETGRPQDFYKLVEPKKKGTTVSDEEMQRFLSEHGFDEAPDSLLTVFRDVQQPVGANQISVFRNGTRQVYEVRPEIAEAFKNLDRPSSELMLKVLSFPARALREGTVISPDFIARNILRDQPLAFAMSKGLYLPVIDMVSGFMSIAKKDKSFVDFMLGGGANSTIVAIDRMYIQGEIGKLSGKTGIGRAAYNVVTSPLQYLAIISEIMENATRIGEFKKVQKKFDKKGEVTRAGIEQGGFAGREVSVDFQRRGAQMQAVSKLAAFLNPHLQGVDRLIREQIDNPVGSTAKLFAAVTLPTILLWIHNHDDERYKGLPRWVKDMYWIVFTDNHTYRIPKSHEAGILYGSLVERMLDAYFTDNPDAFKGFAQRILDSTIVNPIPTILSPMIDQFANRSMFSGKPLIPRAQENLLPEYQYKPYTTELTKEIARVFGAFPGMKQHSIDSNEGTFSGGTARALTSPILVDNYIRSWTGGMGSYILQLTDKAMREGGLLPNPRKPADTLADMFFIRAFVVRHPSMSNQHLQDFWDAYSKRKKTYTTLRKLQDEGDFEAEDRLLLFDPNAEDNLDDIKSVLSDHAKEVRDIERMGLEGHYGRDQMRQIIDTIYFNMINVAKDANREMREMDKLEREFQNRRGERSLQNRSTQGSSGNKPTEVVPQLVN